MIAKLILILFVVFNLLVAFLKTGREWEKLNTQERITKIVVDTFWYAGFFWVLYAAEVFNF